MPPRPPPSRGAAAELTGRACFLGGRLAQDWNYRYPQDEYACGPGGRHRLFRRTGTIEEGL